MSVRFEQAGDDGQLGGPDEIAAIAFSLSIPGLELADCTGPNADGLTPAVIVPPAVAENLQVFVENLFCETRQSCLCPGEGEVREPFVNVVVFGPKDFPAGPPAEIPLLPEGELVAFDLRIAGTGTLPLHIYSELDDPEAFPPPPFTALLSVADREAVDRTADRTSGTSQVIVEDGEVVVLPCVGDCSEDGRVGIEEVVRCARIFSGLGSRRDLSRVRPGWRRRRVHRRGPGFRPKLPGREPLPARRRSVAERARAGLRRSHGVGRPRGSRHRLVKTPWCRLFFRCVS
ncbi:MAG: hypothetical protein KatS3mg076_1664 [Candidatus Binatia bacterium]|nr:MAG: hypothetical protein KatS3mg076_1664 [Candidatus Binatia bacterium]